MQFNRIKISFAGVLIISLSVSCEKIFFQDEPADDPEAIFDYFWQAYEENYAVFDERDVDWFASYEIYRPLVSDQTTEDELYLILTEMLKPLNDGHVTLIAEGRSVFSSNIYYNERIDDSLFNAELVRNNYLDNGYTHTDGYTFGTMQDIAYMYLPYIGDNMPIIDEVLDEYDDAKGLIVDLRHNSGGDFTWALSSLNRLTNENRFVFKSRTKNGPGQSNFTDWFDWYLEPAGDHYDKPVVVLTDRYTISAAERTVMMFQQLPNVTMIGDTTNASHSTLVTGQLANGWFYSLSIQEVLLSDGISYEGIGLAPDIYIKNDPAQMENGIDQVLEEAIMQF